VLVAQFFLLGRPMATLAVQLGGLCIAAGLVFTGVRGLLYGKDFEGKATSKATAIACIVIGGVVGVAALFAGQLMFPEG
jgi:hypothetical protein